MVAWTTHLTNAFEKEITMMHSAFNQNSLGLVLGMLLRKNSDFAKVAINLLLNCKNHSHTKKKMAMCV